MEEHVYKDYKEYSVTQIIRDYKSMFFFFKDCLDNDRCYNVLTGVIPFACMLVMGGYEYLLKENLISENEIDNSDLQVITTIRAKGLKLYVGFKDKTYKSIESFLKNEKEKFLKMANQNIKRDLLEGFVNYYFVAFVNKKAIGNYHLYSKKKLNTEIGIYKKEPEVKRTVCAISRFISQILVAAGIDILKEAKANGVSIEISNKDLNLERDIRFFKIKDTCVLIAFLDILCELNYYIEIFNKINQGVYLDFKFKFSTLFYSITSFNHILIYCKEKGIVLEIEKEFVAKMNRLEKQICKNQLRTHCLHYDYSGLDFKTIEEAFERHFNDTLDNIDDYFTELIKELSVALENIIFNKSFDMIM